MMLIFHEGLDQVTFILFKVNSFYDVLGPERGIRGI